MAKTISTHWIWKGLYANLQSGIYTFSYRKERYIYAELTTQPQLVLSTKRKINGFILAIHTGL